MTLFVWPSVNANLASEGTLSDVLTELDSLNTTVAARLTGSFVPGAYDYMSYTSGLSTDTYVFKTGGAGGTTVKTLVVTWTDNTKSVLATVAAS